MSICSTCSTQTNFPSINHPGICGICFKAATDMMTFFNNLEKDSKGKGGGGGGVIENQNNSLPYSQLNSSGKETSNQLLEKMRQKRQAMLQQQQQQQQQFFYHSGRRLPLPQQQGIFQQQQLQSLYHPGLLAPPQANTKTHTLKGIAAALEWMKEIKEMNERLMKERKERLNHLEGIVVAIRGGIQSDIQVKPGNGLPIPAHRAVLAFGSEIFKNMLESDGCKAAPIDTITLPELNHDELESLLEFLYDGILNAKKIEKHIYSLFLAADKYDIPQLQKLCEDQMLGSLDSSNVLDVLEISDVCSNTILKEAAMSFVFKNSDDIVFSTTFDEFGKKNPHLTIEITRALLRGNDSKRKRNL